MKTIAVTATTNIDRAQDCLRSWGNVPLIIVGNGPKNGVNATFTVGKDTTLLSRKDYLGTVAAFKAGVDYALDHTDAEIIACLHDDLILSDVDWVSKVEKKFDQIPACGLLGFGGAIGLGDADIYQKPYKPEQLARIGFRSNLVDAEVHGIRSLLAERVACLDGFSQIGRREFWAGDHLRTKNGQLQINPLVERRERPWHLFDRLGVTHHAYDSAMGAVAKRNGWECWYLPVRCHHLGGQTAVGDQGYQQWASTQNAGGDHGFWIQAHQAIWTEFKAELPIRV